MTKASDNKQRFIYAMAKRMRREPTGAVPKLTESPTNFGLYDSWAYSDADSDYMDNVAKIMGWWDLPKSE